VARQTKKKVLGKDFRGKKRKVGFEFVWESPTRARQLERAGESVGEKRERGLEDGRRGLEDFDLPHKARAAFRGDSRDHQSQHIKSRQGEEVVSTYFGTSQKKRDGESTHE